MTHELKTYDAYCELFRSSDVSSRETALLLLFMRNNLLNLAEFDKLSSEIFPLGLFDVAKKCQTVEFSSADSDLLTHIVKRFSSAFYHINDNMRKRIIRENTIVPVHKAREINSSGINWLSKKAGSTIKQKLSGGKMMAVERRMNLDTGENRLFVALITLLEKKLKHKLDCLPSEMISDDERKIYEDINRILRNEGFNEIRRWENLTPNNTLLSDRYYRSAWNSWLSINELDEAIIRDYKNLSLGIQSIFFVRVIAELSQYCRIPQIPIIFNYENLSINMISNKSKVVFCDDNSFTVGEIVIEQQKISVVQSNVSVDSVFSGHSAEVFINGGTVFSATFTVESFDNIVKDFVEVILSQINGRKIIVSENTRKNGRKAVVEIYFVRPNYAVDELIINSLPVSLLVQSYDNYDDKFSFPLGTANAVLLTQKFSIQSLRKAIAEGSMSLVDQLLAQIRCQIDVEELVYILPDILNEFQTGIIRKSIKSKYTKSTIFSKSMGIIFQWQYTEKFAEADFKDEEFVLVVDLVDGFISFTLVQGRYDKKLSNSIPESGGIIWERYPTDAISCEEYIYKVEKHLTEMGCEDSKALLGAIGLDGIIGESDNLSVIFENSVFHINKTIYDEILEKNTIEINKYLRRFISSRKSQIGDRRVIVLIGSQLIQAETENDFIDNSAIMGYSEYSKREKLVNFPLWHDHVPALAIKQLYGKFPLLKDEKIEPIFHKSYRFEIPQVFTLPAGINAYHFPLIIGENTLDAQFEATLSSSAFPLKNDVVCNLFMTYRFGVEEPYELVFEPLDYKTAGFKSVKAEWERIKGYETADDLYPEFPPMKSWDELRNYPKKDGTGVNDLVRWTTGIMRNIGTLIAINLKSDNSIWKGKKFCEVNVSGVGTIKVLLSFFENKKDFSEGIVDVDWISCFLEQDNREADKFIAKNIRLLSDDFRDLTSFNPYDMKLSKKHHWGSFFAFHAIFFNGRMISEKKCPVEFSRMINEKFSSLVEGYQRTTVSDNKIFYLKLLCLIAENVPSAFTFALKYLDEERLSADLYAIAPALGSGKLREQQQLLKKSQDIFSTKNQVEDGIIPMLAIALWKNEELIYNLEAPTLLEYFEISLEYVSVRINNLSLGNEVGMIKSRTLRHLEFMLAVFRLRKLQDADICIALSRNNALILDAYRMMERLTDLVLQDKALADSFASKSYVKMEIKKPERYKNLGIPDLLYALLVYISGNRGEGEIRISGIDVRDD